MKIKALRNWLLINILFIEKGINKKVLKVYFYEEDIEFNHTEIDAMTQEQVEDKLFEVIESPRFVVERAQTTVGETFGENELELVIYFPHNQTYFRIFGIESSYAGCYDWNIWEEVKPQEKTIIEYIPVK